MESFDQMNSSLITANLSLQVTNSIYFDPRALPSTWLAASGSEHLDLSTSPENDLRRLVIMCLVWITE